jgi:hypothetical protein
MYAPRCTCGGSKSGHDAGCALSPEAPRYPIDSARALKKAAWYTLHERKIAAIEITETVSDVSTTTRYEFE